MKNLDEIKMRKLSFPDFEVEKMEFSPEQKILKIFVEGAWLEENGGKRLGKGILFFNNWESLTINRFDPVAETWSLVEIVHPEHLKDLCEIKFFNSNVSLCGFGEKIGQWLEWKIVNTKMHAEFESD